MGTQTKILILTCEDDTSHVYAMFMFIAMSLLCLTSLQITKNQLHFGFGRTTHLEPIP